MDWHIKNTESMLAQWNSVEAEKSTFFSSLGVHVQCSTHLSCQQHLLRSLGTSRIGNCHSLLNTVYNKRHFVSIKVLDSNSNPLVNAFYTSGDCILSEKNWFFKELDVYLFPDSDSRE